MSPLVQLVFLVLCAPISRAYFNFGSFNDTASLRFNGDAGTSTCNDGGPYFYSTTYSGNDGAGGGLGVTYREGTATRSEDSVEPYSPSGAREASKLLAGFGSRDAFGGSPDNATGPCPVRLRLTPSRAFKASSVLHVEAQGVVGGWETGFTFQVTDPSLQCTRVKDATFGVASHRACTVAGGDGFAFLVHGDGGVGSGAVGEGGGGLGYAGLRNALAVEFDTWYNTGAGGGGGGASGSGHDLPYDHITIQASPPHSAPGLGGTYLTSGTTTRISGPPLRADIGDGMVHSVRIAYYPYLKLDFIPAFVASTPLTHLLTADAERRRIGTLALWFDVVGGGGVGDVAGSSPTAARDNATTTAPLMPTMALPINLGDALRLPAGGEAWVGFTAATGSTAWQKHDILSWYWCNTGAGEGC